MAWYPICCVSCSGREMAEGRRLLTPVHWLGARADWEMFPGLALYLRLGNLLGWTWEEWEGYPENGQTFLAGLRATF